MNNIEMFQQMLEMQDEINTIVNPDWKQAHYPWHRAVWTECSELVEHFGFKWWKYQEPHWDQIILEIVDIYHFGMSMLLMMKSTPTEIAEDLDIHYTEVIQTHTLDPSLFVEKVEVLAGTATTGVFDTVTFFDVMLTANIDVSLLFSMYVGKNVLNKFRQANGYKDGTYRKVWSDGREDNEHLTDIMNPSNLKLLQSGELIGYIYESLLYEYHITEAGQLGVAPVDDLVVYSNGC